MSSTLKSFAIVAWAWVGVAWAADDPVTIEQQIQMVRSSTEIERQSTLIRGAQLTDDEMQRFVPVYRDYRREVTELNDKLIALLEKYADEYATLSDPQAQSLTRDWLALERDRIELKIRYAKKFDKALPATRVARVLQIENRMDLLQMLGGASTIPLAKP